MARTGGGELWAGRQRLVRHVDVHLHTRGCGARTRCLRTPWSECLGLLAAASVCLQTTAFRRGHAAVSSARALQMRRTCPVSRCTVKNLRRLNEAANTRQGPSTRSTRCTRGGEERARTHARTRQDHGVRLVWPCAPAPPQRTHALPEGLGPPQRAVQGQQARAHQVVVERVPLGAAAHTRRATGTRWHAPHQGGRQARTGPCALPHTHPPKRPCTMDWCTSREE